MNFTNSKGAALHRQIGASFHPQNTFNFEKGYDSEMFDLNKTDIYWDLSDSQFPTVIAGLPQISNNLEVPLTILMDYDGSVSIKIDALKYIDQDIFIKDLLTNKTQQINSSTATYQLKKGVYKNRFVLSFFKNETLSINEELFLTAAIKMYVDNSSNTIVISKNATIDISKVTLVNILGSTLKKWTITERKNNYLLNIKNTLTKGVYIILLNTDKGILNKKILIN